MNGKLKIVLTVLVTFAITVTGCFALMPASSFSELNRVVKIIEDNYAGEYDPEDAETAAINGVLEYIGDPYAEYYSPEEAASFYEMVSGVYVGIGIEIAFDRESDEIIVVGAFEDSPAYNAGVQPLDRIIRIDGQEYGAADGDKAVSYMRGRHLEDPVGTLVTLTVLRDGAEIEINTMRENINMYPVKGETMGENGQIAYFRYSGFETDSYAKLLDEIDKVITETTDSIILDLRSNPGGDFDVAIDVCDIFLEKGAHIMYTMDRSERKKEYVSMCDGITLPMAVLVNGGSASASEIVAGSLQANGRAKVIGSVTYGKGVSQSLFPLSGTPAGSLLKLTTLKNYRPDGICIDDEGISPDIVVAENEDALARAIQYLEQGE
ncbi:MAG: S41 family peptidase [Clostridia bacterium]|nr:S41 family peptidase [Clostridia bacterium]